MKKLDDDRWEVEQRDVDGAKVERGPDSLSFKPEGAVGPIKFEFGGACGCIDNPSIRITSMLETGRDRGCCSMTHEQARALLHFLKINEFRLQDPAPKAGQVLVNR